RARADDAARIADLIAFLEDRAGAPEAEGGPVKARVPAGIADEAAARLGQSVQERERALRDVLQGERSGVGAIRPGSTAALAPRAVVLEKVRRVFAWVDPPFEGLECEADKTTVDGVVLDAIVCSRECGRRREEAGQKQQHEAGLARPNAHRSLPVLGIARTLCWSADSSLFMAISQRRH